MKDLLITITEPNLLIDRERSIANIKAMAEKAKESGVLFRPHFKTHQSAAVGNWFREMGVSAITVSSVKMAEYFAEHDWDDITIAFPVNIREIQRINALAQKIRLNLLVESSESIDFLNKNLKQPLNVWIKVDVGYGRTGVPWDYHKGLKNLTEKINLADKLNFSGLLTHAGHTYEANSVEKINEIFRETKERMQASADLLHRFGTPQVQISVGDTPGCSIAKDFRGVDEVRPGNFVFYDVMQWQLGSCKEEQIAVALACPVVAKHEKQKKLVIHGGAVHLSKDYITDNSGRKIFGYAVELNENGWGKINKERYVSSLSQEHGIVNADDNFFRKIKIGDLLAVLPVHSCLTVNLMKKMMTLKGEKIEAMRS